MDLQLLVPILALGVAGYSAYLQHRQVTLMLAGQEDLPVIPRPTPWWRTPAVVAAFVLAILAWVPRVWSTWVIAKNQPMVGMAGWGLLDLTNRSLQITVASARQDDTQKFMAVAFHYRGDTDIEDVSDLQKSSLYDVRLGVQMIVFHFDDKFAAEWANGMKNTNYILLTVPSTVRPDDFSTLRQAITKGAKIIAGGTGPP
jgi:hypothetical protein